jgi:radical SAM protein with 4Fe4S-binding SPASM domain
MPTFGQYADALHALAEWEAPDGDLRGLDPFSPASRAETQPEVHTSHGCGAGRHICSVSVQGDVNPCSFLGREFETGNVREAPFEVIWRTGQQMRRMREESGDFRGGCRARAKVLAGSVDAADPWMDEHLREGAPHPGANVEVSHCMLSLPVVPA